MTLLLNKTLDNSNFPSLNELPVDVIRLKSSFLRYKSEKPKLNPRIIKPNNLRLSYNNRFLQTKKRMLFKRTIHQNYIRKLNKFVEERLYAEYMEKNMQRVERKFLYKQRFKGIYMNFLSFKNRTYLYTRAFVTHCVKNTFVTIFRGENYRKDNYGMKMLAKVSSGLIGYRGPKKSTVFARKAVIKEAGNILTNHMTSRLDVIFTSKVSRWNRKTVRDLCPNVSYILKIYITYNRSHGYTKRKNKRRV